MAQRLGAIEVAVRSLTRRTPPLSDRCFAAAATRWAVRWQPQVSNRPALLQCLPHTRSFCSQPTDQPPQAEVRPQSDGPTVLWRARPLAKELEATDASLSYSAMLTGGGLGLGLLGIAPFSPPTPFMVGLLLAVLQVRLAHAMFSRQLRAQVRRHVLEVALTEDSTGEDGVRTFVLLVKCDGGLSRTLRLSSAAGRSKPSLAEVLRSGSTFIFLDTSLGSADNPEALQRIRDSDSCITNEDVTVEPFPDETQNDADKVVQPLLSLTHEHLQKLSGKDSATPMASLANIERTAYLTAGVILAGGAVACAGGRYAAAMDSEAS